MSLQRFANRASEAGVTARSGHAAPGSAAARPAGGGAVAGARPRPGLRAKLGIYLLFLAVYLVGASGHFYSTDHLAVYLEAQSIVDDHDLSIKPINDTHKGRGGANYSVFGLGQSVLAVPLYAAGSAVDDVASPDVQRYFRGPQSYWGGTVPIFFVSLFNQLLTPLICVLLFMFLLEMGFSPGVSLSATLVLGFGTAVFSGAHEFFQHPLETLLLLATIYVLFKHRGYVRGRDALLAGALLAVGVLTRINLVLVVPWILLYVIAITRKPRTSGEEREPHRSFGGIMDRLALRRIDGHVLRCACAFLVPNALSLLGLLLVNHVRFATPFAFGLEAGRHGFSIETTPVGLYGILLSPGRSIFLYSPPALLGLFGARRFYERYRAEALLFAAIATTLLLFYSSYDAWHGACAWGPRYFLAIVPLLIIPSAYLLETRRGVLVAAAFCVVGLGVQVLGTVESVATATSAYCGRPSLPDELFLFVPRLSPVPTYLKDLLANRNVDLWLVYVWEQFGTGVLLLTLAVPATLFAIAVFLLGDLLPRTRAADEPNARS